MSSGSGEPVPLGRAAVPPGVPPSIHRAKQRQAAPNGIWGMALFLCAEITLFGTIIGSYYYLDFNSHHWPQAGIAPEPIAQPSLATAWLVVTLAPIWWANRQAHRGRRQSAIEWIMFALAIQAGYLAFQITLYINDFHHFQPQHSAYGSIYYTLMTLDHAHVAFGLLLDIVLIVKLATRGLSNYWLIGVRGLAIYWYVVVAITVIVLFVQLTPSL